MGYRSDSIAISRGMGPLSLGGDGGIGVKVFMFMLFGGGPERSWTAQKT